MNKDSVQSCPPSLNTFSFLPFKKNIRRQTSPRYKDKLRSILKYSKKKWFTNIGVYSDFFPKLLVTLQETNVVIEKC